MALPPTGSVVWAWAGNLSPTGFSVKADVNNPGLYQIVVSPNSNLSSPVFTSSPVSSIGSVGNQLAYSTVSFDVTGLTASTKYYWQIQRYQAPSQAAAIQSLTTAPNGAAAFKILTGSCSKINIAVAPNQSLSTSYIHRSMVQADSDALFFLHMDDIIYSDAPVVDAGYQRDTNVRLYSKSPDVAPLWAIMPLAHIWGDHDALNDSTLATSNGQQLFLNVRTVYNETCPHYPFVQTALGYSTAQTISSQQFDIGKVRFYMADCMSQSLLNVTGFGRGLGSGDFWDQMSYMQTMMNQAQTDGVAWLVIVLPRGWMGYNQVDFNDAFTADRTQLCNYIQQCTVPVLLLTGDTHAVGFDDGGSAGSFSTDGKARFPYVLASAMFNTCVPASPGNTLWNWNSVNKFFTYSGTVPSDGYYVTLSFTSDNKNWTAVCKGTPINPATTAPTTVATVSTTDATRAVSFDNPAIAATHGQSFNVVLDATWFGLASVNWSFNGQNGTWNLLPNSAATTFTLTAPAAGSYPLTLSSPVNCTISGANPATVTVS